MLLKKGIICICLLTLFTGLLACSNEPAHPNNLTEAETRDLIENDIRLVLNHLSSLAKTNYGKNYLADLLEKDLEFSCELKWYEDGKEAGETLGTNDEICTNITRESVDKALFHKVTLSEITGQIQSSSTGHVLGHWFIYPDGEILPSPNALRLEAELVK